MSHFTRLQTRLVEREHLTAALGDLGYRYQEGEVEIRGYGGNRTSVEIKVPTSNAGYDIGFARGESGYDMVADWWGIHDINRDELLASLTRRYAYHATRASLAREGFDLVSEQTQTDGRVHLLLRRMV